MKEKELERSILGYASQVKTPAYVVDERLLEHNLSILHGVMERTGAHILLAQKAFSTFHTYPLVGKYLSGTTASGLYEAKLAKEEMPQGEIHIYSPAYKEEEIDEVISICDHMVFNSPKQWNCYREKVQSAKKTISCGLRINPEYAEIETDIYNPCILGSRLGTTLEQMKNADLEGLEGLHFHTMCEQGADVLTRTIEVIDKKFGAYLKKMKWINFGGGHHITKDGYDIAALEKCIRFFQEKYQLEVYIEPGEAVAYHAGFLVSSVLDIMENGMEIAILDTSAACHMPDVLEMPYRPDIVCGGIWNEKKYNYRLAGPTCLAGDVIGDYSFDVQLKPKDRVVFTDMAIYSMVKNNTFNGMPLPAIYVYTLEEQLKLVKEFRYEDFKMRL